MPPPQPPKAQEDEDGDLQSGHEAANRSNVKTNKDDENLEKEEITTNTTTTPNENSSHEHVAFLQTKTETEETKEE